MKLFFIILLFPTLSMSYVQKDINLSSYGFTRYVKPQLINISQDYQTLLFILNPELKSLKPFYRIFSQLKAQSPKIQETYKSNNKDICLEKINSSLQLLRRGMKLLDSLPQLIKKTHFSPEDMLKSFNQFHTFKKNFVDLYILYENMSFFIQAGILLPQPIEKINHKLNTSYNQFNILLLKTSDNRFQIEFMSFWNDFIKPINNLILPQNNKRLFVTKLNDFNLRLNFLNVSLTKRNKSINSQTATILKIIHRRWNSILKVTLKR